MVYPLQFGAVMAGSVVVPLPLLRSARLSYVSDAVPGIRRIRRGKGFIYLRPNGRRLSHHGDLKRIQSLAIPPAWREVWICPRPDGHIQAVGRDDRGRKQYRYHPRWSEVRGETKFEKLIDFGLALPELRRQVKRHLKLSGLPREKVMAAAVALLDRTYIRIGNDEYAKQNGSFGLTTLKDRHARIRGDEVVFRFRGKSGIEHEVGLKDRRLSRIVRKCQELPGQRLFQYVDEQGKVSSLGSTDVNEYLRQLAGEAFTAKDFRTWAGTVLAFETLCGLEPRISQREAKRELVAAVRKVAAELGNTAAICRKCYIHPSVCEAFLKSVLPRNRTGGTRRGLSPSERAVLSFLKKGRAALHRKPVVAALSQRRGKPAAADTRLAA
jgi:DNA topoisomerase I